MRDPEFQIGQKIKMIPVSGHDPEVDRMLSALAGKKGVVEKYYCIGRDEMPDRIKMFAYPEYVYSYDIHLEDGDILRGIPEIALQDDTQTRK
jgi:hypothetical protein